MTLTTSRQHLLLRTTALVLLSATTVRADWGPGGGSGYWGQGNGPWSDGNWGCRVWGGSDCNDDDGNGNGSGSSGILANLSQADLERYNRLITIHAVLACLVWVFFIPLGGILLRLPFRQSPWTLRLHGILQLLSYLTYIVAAAIGVYLVRSLTFPGFSLWSDPHTKLGVAILVLGFLQPFLGVIHHTTFKSHAKALKSGQSAKLPGRTATGYIHLWLGRLLIVLGMTNGGLGLRLASQGNSRDSTSWKAIAYGVGAGLMFLIYLVFVILGERRRSKDRSVRKAELTRNGVPLAVRDEEGVQRSGSVPPVYNHPPSYEASEDSVRKEGQTTARYT